VRPGWEPKPRQTEKPMNTKIYLAIAMTAAALSLSACHQADTQS
jgi:hypothetical protein